MADTDTLAVFFGQPHLPEAAMARSCILYNKAVLDAAPSATLFYRPHPREDRDRVVEILSQASSEGCAPTLAEDGDTNALLTACDSAASAFSNCGYDLAWLNRYAKTPLAVMMYVMTEPDIRQIWRDYTGLYSEPVSDQGLAVCVEDEDDLVAVGRNLWGGNQFELQ